MLMRWQIAASAAIVALFLTLATRSQDLTEVARNYLQRQGVPCLAVTHVDRTQRDMDMVATCQDGREWALFIVEGEVAFVHPRTRDLYRWHRDVHRAHPEVYAATPSPQDQTPAGD
jgi:hypothetical protein